MNNNEPMFEFGDQDYGSARGWDPNDYAEKNRYTRVANIIEEDKKLNPRAYARVPEMLFSMPLRWWVRLGVRLDPMERLFGPFWTKGELAILFAQTGIGKSALATQIAESLARGYRVGPFQTSDAPAEPHNVLYLDFELSTEQLAPRYSVFDKREGTYIHPYEFSGHLIRSVLNWKGDMIDGYDGFSNMFFTSLANTVEYYQATAVIIDNITFLDESSTSNISTALSVMRSLNELKRRYGVSILVLAHTRKRHPRFPLSERDLQGSINLANFADSVFAIGPSRRSRDLRYVKQVKSRSGRIEYDASNIALFSFKKFDTAATTGLVANTKRDPVNNFLGYHFVKNDIEENHLDLLPAIRRESRAPLKKKSRRLEDIRNLAAKGKSAREIAIELGISKSTSHRLMQKMQ